MPALHLGITRIPQRIHKSSLIHGISLLALVLTNRDTQLGSALVLCHVGGPEGPLTQI